MVTKESVRELIGDWTAEGFVRILKNACAPAEFVSVGREYAFGDDGEAKVRVLGVVRDLPDENGLTAPLVVADVPLESELTERSSRIRQFKLAKKVLEHFAAMPPMELDGVIAQGVFVFHDATGRFRVSLVTATPENGKFNWSKARRQSFFVTNDPDANATFVQRMCMNWSTLKGIKDAFSVEKLTKEFYDQLFKWYERSCADERVEYPNGLDTDADNREDQNRKHLLRLITRLMFVWFLRQKGLVPKELFDEEALRQILKNFDPVAADQHQYYRAILQNLFFATLNSEIGDREFADSPRAKTPGGKTMTKHHGIKTKYRYADEFRISRSEVLDLFRSIPFLNGGLFECLDQEGEDGKVMYYDGFSQQERHRDLGTLTWAHVPNDLFFNPDYGIIPLLKRYNFTVEENSPGDEDVALDPELLGKVFENLLGAYNPETKEVVRKSTGSFYTPREIVNYMVDESLIAYLAGKTKADEQTVRALVADGIRPSDDALCERLVDALENAKILDPACGSGAFPMGALLKMTELLRILKKLPEGVNLYDLKLKLIENCIFGSDIQEIAVQISKLRVFISLVCEQKPDWSAPNYGINTLPNLETKYVAANSLIGLEQGAERDLFFDAGEIKKTKDELWKVRHKHFLAKTRREKNELRRQDKELRTKLADAAKKIGYSEESTRLMASWDPYNQNVHAEFFDPEWMFNVKDGFDIVIGNPPYGANVSEEEKKQYKEKYIVAQTKNGVKGSTDTFVVFINMGYDVLAKDGMLTFIVPMAVTSSDAMMQLHELLNNNVECVSVSSYSNRPKQIFDAACVRTSILSFKKTMTKNKHILTTRLQRRRFIDSIGDVISKLEFVDSKAVKLPGRYAKISNNVEKTILEKCFATHNSISLCLAEEGLPVYYRAAGGRYFNVITNFTTNSVAEKTINVNAKWRDFICAALSTTLFWFYQQVYTDGLNLKAVEIKWFPLPSFDRLDNDVLEKVRQCYQEYLVDIERNAIDHGKFKEYKLRKSKSYIDNLDDLIDGLYGLTKSEIIYLKNYEVEFRLPDYEQLCEERFGGGASKSEVGTIAPLPDAPKPKKRPPKIKEEF